MSEHEERICGTISAQDAVVLKALHEYEDTDPLDLIADALGLSMADLRASMRRLFLRVPVPNEMRLVKGGAV